MQEITKEAWEPVRAKIAETAIFVGAYVRVTGGRKHLKKEGKIFWHGRDKFAGRQYGSDWSLALRDMVGKSGFRAGVETETGERFFIPADYLDRI